MTPRALGAGLDVAWDDVAVPLLTWSVTDRA